MIAYKYNIGRTSSGEQPPKEKEIPQSGE